MSRIVLTAASRVGCIRSNNEDMVLAYDKMVRSDAYRTEFMTENNERFVIALADGMGGHRAGEVASEQTLSSLKFFINDIPRGLSISEFNETMLEWLHHINDTINRRGHSDPSLYDMGTTLVGVIYYGGKYFWLNCGDSRLYRLRDGKLVQLSTDHSLSNAQGEKKHSNIITNCIGAGCKNSYLDLYEFTNDVMSGDTYMLCSDGLTDMVRDEKITALLANGADANALCDAAVAAGGLDNVSCCVIEIK
jgi:protein phosphatase